LEKIAGGAVTAEMEQEIKKASETKLFLAVQILTYFSRQAVEEHVTSFNSA
jgi:hypothetical protein